MIAAMPSQGAMPALEEVEKRFLVAISARCAFNIVMDHAGPHGAAQPGQAKLRFSPAPNRLRHAAAAQARMLGIDADVGAVVPAALAFLLRRRRDDDRFLLGVGDFGHASPAR